MKLYLKCRCFVELESPYSVERSNQAANKHAKETGHDVWYGEETTMEHLYNPQPDGDPK